MRTVCARPSTVDCTLLTVDSTDTRLWGGTRRDPYPGPVKYSALMSRKGSWCAPRSWWVVHSPPLRAGFVGGGQRSVYIDQRGAAAG